MRADPNFKGLVGNHSKESIVNMYKVMGAKRFAEELKGQDLSKLISYYRKFGF
jgi:hypothetical protein